MFIAWLAQSALVILAYKNMNRVLLAALRMFTVWNVAQAFFLDHEELIWI